MSAKRPALGRGLSALLENAETDITSGPGTAAGEVVGAVAGIPLDKIEANPFQPRSEFNDETLDELADSIRANGIIQPITVRKVGFGRFQLISGERRLKAAGMAGLKEVPAFIRIANDQAMLELALIENIQREDLDPIDIAISYQRLKEECNLTHEELSARVSKRRSTVSNYLRLLKLPAEIQLGLRQGSISMGHARALLGVAETEIQMALYEETVEHDLSVRQVENLVRTNTRLMRKTVGGSRRQRTTYDQPELAERLSISTGQSVAVKINAGGRGRVIIYFNTDDELENLVRKLSS